MSPAGGVATVDWGLEGKVVVITGAGSGIGLACARAFGVAGAHLVLGDLRPPAPEEVGATEESVFEVLDFREPDAATRLVSRGTESLGGVDVLVNNVGIGRFREGFMSISDEDWDELMTINFLAAVRACRACLPSMVSRGGGAIVSIASDAGRQPDPFFVDYAASKAALLSLSKSLSIEFGPSRVRVNSVSPGPTMTPAMRVFLDEMSAQLEIDPSTAPDHFAREVRGLPLGRMNDPAEVANVVLFLASDLAGQVTGSDYRVDAGAVRSI